MSYWTEGRPYIMLTKEIVAKLNDILVEGLGADAVTVSPVGDHGLITVRTYFDNNLAAQKTYVLNKHGKEVKV